MVRRIRYWDLASSVDSGDWSVGLRMSRTDAGLFYVEDVIRGQWGPFDRDKVILQTAHIDSRGLPIRIEQEPGSAGVSMIASLVRIYVGANTFHESYFVSSSSTTARPPAPGVGRLLRAVRAV
jgi:phage terminase large subunit-like protein